MENNQETCFICKEALNPNVGIWWYPIAKELGWKNPASYASHKKCFDLYFEDVKK